MKERCAVLALAGALSLIPAGGLAGQGTSCAESLAHAEAARLRAARSVARARMAVLRIRTELQRAGLVEPQAIVRTGPETEPPLGELIAATGLEAVTGETWILADLARNVSNLAITERTRHLPEPERRAALGPDVRPRSVPRTPAPGGDCDAWAESAQRAAFAAEQAAQLASVASDQILGRTDYLRAWPRTQR